MARIDSYPTIQPRTSDLLLISDVSEENNPTKTVTISSVLALSSGGGGGGGLSGSGSTGQVTFWDSSSSINGDNAFFFDNTNKILGLGTITPAASSILDLTSVTKGFLPPRMTAAQRDAIGSPSEGLIVYVTDASSKGAYQYNGTAWTQLGGNQDIYTSAITPTTKTVQQTIGGFTQGTTVASLNGQTFSQMFDTLIFPSENPTKTDPSATMTSSVAALQEIGATSPDFTLVTGGSQGTLSNPSGPYTGDVTSAVITGSGGPYTLTVSNNPLSISNQVISGHAVIEGNNTWTLTVDFAQGPMPLVFPSDAQFPSLRYNASNKAASHSFEGVYPYYLGTSQGTTEKAPLVSHDAGRVNPSDPSTTTNIIQADQAYQETSSLKHIIQLSNAMVGSRTYANGTLQVWQYVASADAYLQMTPGTLWQQTTVQVGGVNYQQLKKVGSTVGATQYRIRLT
mgnify:CR=1 FL=1